MAKLILFPMARNAGRARHVAAMLNKREGREREVYFRSIVQQLEKRLGKLGVSPAEAARQVQGFTDAVNVAVAEGWHFEEPQPPGHQSGLFDRQPEGAA